MAQTSIATQKPFGPYGTVAAAALDLTWTAADTSNGNSFSLSGNEILLIWNTDTASHDLTITSVADAQGRTGDVTSYSVGAGVVSAYSFRGGTAGWKQSSDGTVHFMGNDATLKFAILSVI